MPRFQEPSLEKIAPLPHWGSEIMLEFGAGCPKVYHFRFDFNFNFKQHKPKFRQFCTPMYFSKLFKNIQRNIYFLSGSDRSSERSKHFCGLTSEILWLLWAYEPNFTVINRARHNGCRPFLGCASDRIVSRCSEKDTRWDRRRFWSKGTTRSHSGRCKKAWVLGKSH